MAMLVKMRMTTMGAQERLEKANKSQLNQWLNKVIVAQSLGDVIGKK